MLKRGVALSAAVSLSACALWTDFIPPETDAPARWRSADADAPREWPDSGWWREFGSPPLESMLAQAEASNLDLRAAVARVTQADAQARISGAGLLPSVNASAAASRTDTIGSRNGNAYTAQLGAAYELDFWGRQVALAESARALGEASRFDRQTVAMTVAASVAGNYFDILATKQRLAVARKNLAAAEKLLSSIRYRFTAGQATALDVAQQENAAAAQRAALPPLEQRLWQAIHTQALLLGRPPDQWSPPEETLADIAVPVLPSGLPSELLRRRPDVQTAQARLEAAHADTIAARAQLFPSVTLTGSGGVESATAGRLFTPGGLAWSAAGSLAQPLFQGGRLLGALELQKARYEELLQAYRKAVLTAFTEAENAIVAVKQSAAWEEEQRRAAVAAERAEKLAQLQMDGGIVDITRVLEVRRAALAAQDGLAQARLAHLQALVGLYKALGGGFAETEPERQGGSGIK